MAMHYYTDELLCALVLHGQQCSTLVKYMTQASAVAHVGDRCQPIWWRWMCPLGPFPSPVWTTRNAASQHRRSS